MTVEVDGQGDWNAVAEAIKARMAALRLKQADLAHRSGISPATIREITNSPRPRRRYGRTLAALSQALDWPADHLDTVLTGRAATPQVMDEIRAIRQEIQAIKERLYLLEGHL